MTEGHVHEHGGGISDPPFCKFCLLMLELPVCMHVYLSILVYPNYLKDRVSL